MIKHLTKWVSALLFAVCLSNAAQATTYSVGTLDPSPTTMMNWVGGSFEDVINFTIASPNNHAITTVLQIPMTNIYHIGSFTAALYNATTNTVIGSWNVGSGLFLEDDLAGGNYYLKLTGVGNGKNGGMYTVTAAAVPEPGEWAMMLAGIGMMGAMVRRRRRA